MVITSFKSIGEFKLELQYWNAQIRSKLAIFLSCGVLKFGGWLWKTTGILFNTVSSVVHNFKSIGEYMSYSVETRVTTSIICPLWPWNLMDDLEKIGHLFYITLSLYIISKPRVNSNKIYSSETKRPIWVKIGDFFPLWPWNLTDDLENNRALLYTTLSFFYASFRSHRWYQTVVTVRKRSIRVKIGDFCPVWPYSLSDDLEKLYGTSSMLFQALCIIS